MKRFAAVLAFVAMTVLAFAQAPAKRSIASVSDDGARYEVFAFDEPDGARAYYLGLGTADNLFLLLGNNVNDAAGSVKKLLALFSAPIGDSCTYHARFGNTLPEGDMVNAKVVVEKKLKKQLVISCKAGDKKASAVMQKASAKTLLKFVQGYQKRHPDR